jgi:hypothetical protein
MTIFDSLRYPIKDNMALAEFAAIPLKIREKWANHPTFRFDFSFDQSHSLEVEQNNTDLLRKIIAEWEE